MRTIAVVEIVPLDGVMQSPSGSEENPSGGFAAGGWAAPLATDPAASRALKQEGEGEIVVRAGVATELGLP